jgi:C-terminal processing protease CtpA/Prc
VESFQNCLPSEKITIEIHETHTIDSTGNQRTEIEKSVTKIIETKNVHSDAKPVAKNLKASSSSASSKKGFKILFSDKTKSSNESENSSKQTQDKPTKKEKSKKVKIDYTLPRKCQLEVVPNFDGLGIHISCEPDTCKSPYIHEIEPNSPGLKGGLKKGDFILEINGEDAVNMDFNYVINNIKSHMETNDLVMTVGNQKVYKKWIKAASKSSRKHDSLGKSKKSY